MKKITIDQVAIGVRSGEAKAKVEAILSILGAKDWIMDTVTFDGKVKDEEVKGTKANLNFNYDLIDGVEFEILEFTHGENWHNHRSENDNRPFISHFGFHVEDVARFNEVRIEMKEKGIKEIQFAKTTNHENENVPADRSYEYIIFDTIDHFGFDLKMILRTTK